MTGVSGEVDAGLVRYDHDPQRPALNTRQAGDRIGVTSQAVIDRIKRGAVEGYCLAGPQRKRWFAFVDSVERLQSARTGPGDDAQELRERVAKMENALAEQRAVADLRNESHTLFEQAARQMAEANKALVDAYERLSRAQELAASFTQSDWVPAYPPGGG